jgi:glutamine---fructose-6-phosphate transaminase (isomerizing)
VKSLGNFPDHFLVEIVAQPAAMRRAAEALGPQQGRLEELARARDRAGLGGEASGGASPTAGLAGEASGSAGPAAGEARGGAGEVVLTGMGASYGACHAPATLLGEAGVRAWMLDAAELVHFRTGVLRSDTVLVTVSQSGASAEVIRLAEAVRAGRRPFLVSVTNGTASRLAGLADVALDVAAGAERGPSTLTFAATLVTLAAVAEVLAGRSATAAIEGARWWAEAGAAAAERLLDAAEPLADRMRRWLGRRPMLAVLGRGTARAASETAALVLKEAARFPAEALESAQFRHGPLELAGRDLAVAILALEPSTGALDLGLARELAAAGAAVSVLGPREEGPGGSTSRDRGLGSGDGWLSLGLGDVPRPIAPAVAAIPFHLLAWRLAVERGLDPGELALASKVTTRE